MALAKKDDALKLRERYFAMKLPSETGMSHAALERRVWVGIKVTKRDVEGGTRQPFAFSKVAAGTRGLSYNLKVPDSVARLGEEFPSTLDNFVALLWAVLTLPRNDIPCEATDINVGAEVRSRLHRQHLRHPESGSWELTELGIRRVGRLSSIGALGLLLLHTPPFAGITRGSLMARDRLSGVFIRLCAKDRTFAALSDEFERLIYRLDPKVRLRCNGKSLFAPKEPSAIAVAISILMEGEQFPKSGVRKQQSTKES